MIEASMTDYELYRKSKELLTREILGEEVAWKTDRLYKECQRRNPLIWEKALEDAQKISSSVEETYEAYGTYPNDYTRIISINRIDFCTPKELKQVIGIKTDSIEDIIKIIDSDYFSSKVKGDSMIGAGICPGDIVLVEKTNRVNDNAIAVVEVRGRQIVKRINFVDEGILLKSENPKYQPMFVNFGEAEPFGVVRYCIKAIS